MEWASKTALVIWAKAREDKLRVGLVRWSYPTTAVSGVAVGGRELRYLTRPWQVWIMTRSFMLAGPKLMGARRPAVPKAMREEKDGARATVSLESTREDTSLEVRGLGSRAAQAAAAARMSGDAEEGEGIANEEEVAVGVDAGVGGA